MRYKKYLPVTLVTIGTASILFSVISSSMPLTGVGIALVIAGVVAHLRLKKTSSKNILISVVLISTIIFLCSGCAVKIPMSPDVGYLGISKKLPAKAALLIPEDTRKYVFTGKPESLTGALRPHAFPLGMAMEQASVQAFSQVFRDVSLVRTPAEAKRYGIVIEPEIEDFHFRYDQLTYVGFGIAVLSKIKVRVTLASGKTKIWERSIESPEQKKGPWMVDLNYEKKVGESASSALVYTLKKIAKEIARDATVKRAARGSVSVAKAKPKKKPALVRHKKTVQQKRQEVSSVSQRWAVVVGISDYDDSRIPSLRYAATDAKTFYNWLISPQGGRYTPSRVKLLLNKKATGKNIKNALFVWLKRAIKEDLVTIYFAGHGSPESPDSPDNLFLLPYDTQYDNIAATGFPMWDIETALKRFIKARKVIVIADACHSGGVGQSFDVARRAARAIKVNPISSGLQSLSKMGDGVCVISASDDKQFSQEDRKWGGGHGVFTYFLLEGLKGEADYSRDGHVTLGELIPFLSEQVRRETRNAQSPTIAGKFDPAITIGR